MIRAIQKKLGFHLELDECLTWWVVWEDETRQVATEKSVRLWEALLAEVTAQAKRRKIRAT